MQLSNATSVGAGLNVPLAVPAVMDAAKSASGHRPGAPRTHVMVLPVTVVESIPLTPIPVRTRALSEPVELFLIEAPVPMSAVVPNQALVPSARPI